MPKALSQEKRDELKQGWIAFIEAVMAAYRFSATDLARKLGVSPWTVYLWLNPGPKGTLPSAAASTLLKQLAEARGLIDRGSR